MQFENKRSVTIVAGLSGTGKSTFGLRYLVNADLAARFCFDPDGEFAERLELKPARNIYDLQLQFIRGYVVYDPHAMFAGRLTEAFAFFCDLAFAWSERIDGRKVLVVDEVWKYCTPAAIPDELALVCQTGRKRGLGLMVNTQRPNKLNGSILNEVSEMVCFRLQEENALEKVSGYGFNADELKALPDLHLVARNLDSGGERRGRIKN
jgi:DNA helicase HerA-like ATPase